MNSWKLTIRTAPGALVAAEYECPVHGRFAVDVPRDENGDPPVTQPCPARAGCEVDGPNCPCCRTSPHVISAPGRVRVKLVEAVRGKDQKPEHKTWSDMTNLMEGQDVDEWREERERKVWDDERHKAVKEILNG